METVNSLANCPLDELLDKIVTDLRNRTGYDRVIFCKVEPDQSIKMAAESMSDRVTTSFKGYMFPPKDLSATSRILFYTKRIFCTYNFDSPGVEMIKISSDDDDVDISTSSLILLNKNDVGYLQAMGACAFFTISIALYGELWGVFTFQNITPKRPHFTEFEKLDSVSQFLSSLFECKFWKEKSDAQYKLSDQVIHNTPFINVFSNNHVGNVFYSDDTSTTVGNVAITVLMKELIALKTLFQCDFAILKMRDYVTLMDAKRESEGHVYSIVKFLSKCQFKDMIYTRVAVQRFENELKQDSSALKAFSKVPGLMHLPISSDGSNFIAFLKNENVQVKKWASKPDFPIDSVTLVPGSNITIYNEIVHGSSTSWDFSEISIAKLLRIFYGKFTDVWMEAERVANLDKLKTMSVANVSHELRTPLHAIINFLEQALENELDKETDELITQACMAGRRLVEIINDLLEVSKIDSGKVKILLKPFSPKSIISNVAELLKVSAIKKKLDVSLVFDENFKTISNVIGDETKLWQILTNIVNNSIKYTEKGKIDIFCYLENSKDGMVDLRISVFDTGVGIPESKLETIFNAFERVENDDGTEIVAEGTGLGLSIVARLIHMQGGTLTVKSKLKEGSCFELIIPYKISELPAVKKNTKKDIWIPKLILYILVVEDNVINQTILKKRLERDGHTVLLAANGVDCLALFKENQAKIDVILMDVRMPVMDGLECTKLIREYEHDGKRVVILGCSAYSYGDSAAICFKSGFDGYIMKPIEYSKLRFMLNELELKAESRECDGWFLKDGKLIQDIS